MPSHNKKPAALVTLKVKVYPAWLVPSIILNTFSILAGKFTILFPARVPVNFKVMFLAFETVASVITRVTSPDATSIAWKPATDCWTRFKLLFVFVPHVPAFSPVAISSNFKSEEKLDAIIYIPYFCYLYCLFSFKSNIIMQGF